MWKIINLGDFSILMANSLNIFKIIFILCIVSFNLQILLRILSSYLLFSCILVLSSIFEVFIKETASLAYYLSSSLSTGRSPLLGISLPMDFHNGRSWSQPEASCDLRSSVHLVSPWVAQYCVFPLVAVKPFFPVGHRFFVLRIQLTATSTCWFSDLCRTV